ncbi:MAG: nucleoside deaminase [Bacteroidota bacterium]
MTTDRIIYLEALKQAQKSLSEGGIPIGAVLFDGEKVIGAGHNQRVQKDNPILHGEMDCLQNAGRHASYKGMTLYTTLSPCMMCSGTIVQFKIKRVVVGEKLNFEGNIPFLQQHGVEVILLHDEETTLMMKNFIDQNPVLWNEDITE